MSHFPGQIFKVDYEIRMEGLGETVKLSTVTLVAARRYEATWKQYRGNFPQTLEALTVCEAEFGPDPAIRRPGKICESCRPQKEGGHGQNHAIGIHLGTNNRLYAIFINSRGG
jgi:hypothetical protein